MEARRALLPQEGPLADSEAKELVAFYAGKTVPELLADFALYGPDELSENVNTGVVRILEGEPLPYIIGEWDFAGMTLKVTKDTLIPRDDSAALLELSLDYALRLPPNPRILDLCTGTGCLGLAIANKIRDAYVVLGDLSRPALEVAKENIRAQHLGSRVFAVEMDAKAAPPPIINGFDMIVSNPPYVTEAEMETLPPSVKNYEPPMALCGGKDGLDFYRSIVSGYACALKEDGIISFEFGLGQENAVGEILEEAGFRVLDFRKDLSGIVRAVSARKKREDL